MKVPIPHSTVQSQAHHLCAKQRQRRSPSARFTTFQIRLLHTVGTQNTALFKD
jgi:hypothetical protein